MLRVGKKKVKITEERRIKISDSKDICLNILTLYFRIMANHYVNPQATYIGVNEDGGVNVTQMDNNQMAAAQMQCHHDDDQANHHQMGSNNHGYHHHGGNQHGNQMGAPVREEQPIPHEELMNEFVHPSIFTSGGVLINFLNHNCPDSATIIGGIRMRSAEIQRVPSLLSQYYSAIKTHAAYALQKHMVRSQSALGLNEAITVDDFSLTFMLGSLSEEGISTHPYGRKEGPLHYCYFANFIKPKALGYTHDGKLDSCYIINAYVHLNEAGKRRNAVVKKTVSEKRKIEEPKPQSNPAQVNAKKPKFQKRPNQQQAPELDAVKDSISRIEKQVMKLNLPGKSAYPDLPETALPVWPPTDAHPEMPSGL